jgi:hypothetical protein
MNKRADILDKANCWNVINYNKKNPAGIIWANVMNNIHRDLNDKTFNRPYTIEQLNICIETGYLANTGCKNTYTEYFTKDNLPNDCTIHEGEPLDKVDSAVRNTTQSYTISQNTVVQVIDDIKATWDEIKGNQDKIEEKTTQIINEIQKANSN